MKRSLGTANTDAVNRARIRFPVDVLAASIEKAIKQANEDQTAYGMVSLISHDLLRPIGWTIPLGLHLSGTLARLAIVWEVVDTKEESQEIGRAHVRALQARYVRQGQGREADFRKKVGPEAEGCAFRAVGGALGLEGKGLATRLYPDLFGQTSSIVDKDGLVSLATLLDRFDIVTPGIFKDRERNVLLFAHAYFRRSLSHLNTLNDAILEQLLNLQKDRPDLDIRLRLDPDRIGDPPAQSTIELEHWWGPSFKDDISQIATGVARHAASESTMLYSGIEFTDFWWKAAEDRPDGARVRTFEMEELPLLDVPSAGISAEYWGARYLHAEYTEGHSAITHFDGAIRGYPGEKYLARQEADIKSAGKHADYTKLFRVDGRVPVALWKKIACAYFRNNDLVPEYLGAMKSEDEQQDAIEQVQHRAKTVPVEGMVSYIPLDLLKSGTGTVLRTFEQPLKLMGEVVCPFDLPPQKTKDWFDKFGDFTENVLISHKDGNVNLPTMVFRDGTSKANMDKILQELGQAIGADNYIGKVGCSFIWPHDDYWVALSLLGEASAVASALRRSVDVIDPQAPPSTWITEWKAVVCSDGAPNLEPGKAFGNLRYSGLLSFPHETDGQTVDVLIPPTHALFVPMSQGMPPPSDGSAVSDPGDLKE